MFAHVSRFRILTFTAALAAAISTASCDFFTNPVVFSVTVPAPNQILFQANLTQHFDFGLSGSYDLPKGVGTITLEPDTPQKGLGLGFDLNTRSFLKETWVDFNEVTTLPTGAAFPSWMTGGVVDIYVPKFDTGPVKFHFYLGDHDQYYVGAAGLIRAIDEHFPAINIGYTFYDKAGHVVLGLQFFGPKLGSNGHAVVPGGIFLGTNLTPLLPAQPKPSAAPNVGVQTFALSTSALVELGQRSLAGKPVTINGKSVVAELRVSGRDAHRYRSRRKVKAVVDQYLWATRNPW